MYTKFKQMQEGIKARNWPGVIHIDPDCDRIGAVWAQERYEAGWKLNPVHMLRFLFDRHTRIEMEITGREIEVQAANIFYGRDPLFIRALEAAALATHHDFRHLGRLEINARMIEQTDYAKEWIKDHREEILDFIDRANMT